jgi:rhamnosyltransferase subunit B
MARILLHTLGSSGDFNPFIALALALRDRGHQPKFAVNPGNAAKIRALGLDAVDAGPDMDTQSDLMRRMLKASLTEPIDILFREMLVPAIVPATEGLIELCADADVFVSHPIQLASPAVAYKTGIPWVTATPVTNCYPTEVGPIPSIAWRNPPALVGKLAWKTAHDLMAPIDQLANAQYERLGVPPRKDVVLGGCYSPLLTLCLWSESFFPRPSDWPDFLKMGGYARWDGSAPADAPALRIPEGDAPLVVFTLGSSVINHANGFWETALEAAGAMNCRAVLLGAPNDFEIPASLSARVVALRYAPYHELFPHASAIVHQGGVGTTQAACYYGVPALVVPRGFDQFENAAHIQRNGWGLRLLPSNLSPQLLRRRLQRLLDSKDIAERVEALGKSMRAEPGAERSAEILESVLGDMAGAAAEPERALTSATP